MKYLENNSQTVWLFDYDLTLYGEEERCVLNSLDKRIAEFVQKTVGGSFENATKIRKDYLIRFGTTLSGLMAVNETLPDVFFDFIHEPEYLIYPKYAPEKINLLKLLKGFRMVFTNGRHDWCETGMKTMGISDCINGVFDLKQLDWVGKPHETSYEKMESWLASQGLMPHKKSQIVLLEDSLRNLEPAHARGWTTILVNPNIFAPGWVDFSIPHLLNLKDVIQLK